MISAGTISRPKRRTARLTGAHGRAVGVREEGFEEDPQERVHPVKPGAVGVEPVPLVGRDEGLAEKDEHVAFEIAVGFGEI